MNRKPLTPYSAFVSGIVRYPTPPDFSFLIFVICFPALCAAATVEQLEEEELARLYHIPIPKQTDLPISYNIAPSQKVLTIRFNPEIQQRSLDALQ